MSKKSPILRTYWLSKIKINPNKKAKFRIKPKMRLLMFRGKTSMILERGLMKLTKEKLKMSKIFWNRSII